VIEPERDEIDALAGEYVLGTLEADERRAAEARLASDRDFRAAVAAWESRLQPLADGAAPLDPPHGLLERILGRLDGQSSSPAANVVELHRAVRRWRLTSAIVGAAAAALAGIVVLDLVAPPVQQTEFVAVLTAEGAAPKFVATVNVAEGTLSIRRVGEAPPPDRSYELWAIEPGRDPQSLGVVEEASLLRTLDYSPDDLTLAISLEPEGGSPTGAPTGPVVFSGALVPTE
jgi:anti-sigma-K factor RskA